MNELIARYDRDGVAYLTLQRPDAYNSLSIAMMEGLMAQFRLLADDESIRVVVIEGAGRGFCAGHDLKEMLENDDVAFHQQTFETCSALMQSVAALPIPVIAKVHGVATAAGCQLVASCDLAYADQSARFGTPGVNIGLFCSTPMVALTRAIAPKHALEMLYSGEMISAPRAVEMGLINQTFATEELALGVERIASLIASKSRKTLSIGKAAFHQQRELPVTAAYQQCSQVMTDNLQTADAREGIDAFIHKRTPNWQHR